MSGDEILTSFDDDCRLLEEAVSSGERLRIKSAVVVCRRMLLEGMLHQVQRQLGIRQRLEFHVADLLGLDLATILGLQTQPTMQLSMMNDGLSPDAAPPGAKRLTLTLDQFVGQRVAVQNGQEISVKEVIKFLANQDGAVHFEKTLDAEDQKLRDVNRSIQIMNADALMSCIRGVARVLLATALPLRAAVLWRYLSQSATYTPPVPPTHLEVAKGLLRDMYQRRDWDSTKRVLLALRESSTLSGTPNPTFEDHLTILFQWGNVHLIEVRNLDNLLWIREFARSLVAGLKPERGLADRSLSIFCAPLLRLARDEGREEIAHELEQQLRAAYAADPQWQHWATAIEADVLARWSTTRAADA